MAKIHVAMFPWFAIGHITPYIHLANELAARGHKVTLLLPNKTQLHFQQHLRHYPNLLTFHPIMVPHVDGLPLGAETASDVPYPQHALLAAAMDRTRDQVQDFLFAYKPQLLFYDFAHWLPAMAKKVGTTVSVYYSAVSASSSAFAMVPSLKVPHDRPATERDLKDPPPGYPSSAVVHRGSEELRGMLVIFEPFGEGGVTFYGRITAAMRNSDVIGLRTCREVEGKYCDYIGEQYGKPVLLTGPILPEVEEEEDRLWSDWLGGFEPGSVVFCAFGSQHVLEKDQFQELVLGFELSGSPFLIVLKPPVGCETVEEALPEGFKERTMGRGVVHGGWVKQRWILSHRSVGCFVSHCGFGSMWESLLSDNQIVLVPNLGDQILNARLLADELKVAVELERGEDGRFSKESLSKAIKSVMDLESEVGIMVRNNHTKWREELGKPGFMSGYVDKFVESLKELVYQNHRD